MLYLIGLGLNVDGISSFGMEILGRCKRVYLENYTVNFPYTEGELSEKLEKKLISADREMVESLSIVDEAQKMDVALLVYGSPLSATTHISLIEEAKRLGVRVRVIYAASIFDAIAETGLQLYKFGKTTSMPKWDRDKKFTPDSFMKIVQENQSMKAHSLILVDIGLDYDLALDELESAAEAHKISLKDIVVCQGLGTRNKRIVVGNLTRLRDFTINSPFCLIVPSKLHFVEKKFLESFR